MAGEITHSILKTSLARANRSLNQISSQLLKFGTRDGHVHVLGTIGRGGDERKVDVRLHGGGELLRT